MKVLLLLLSVALFRAQVASSTCTNVICPSGSVCLEGACYRTCSLNTACAPGYICTTVQTTGAVVSVCITDPCASCPAGSHCDASTGNRCVLDLCADKVCPTPTMCDANTGHCYCTATTGCPSGQTCTIAQDSTIGYCASDPCATVTCASPSTCVNGVCVTASTDCTNTPCPSGLVCSSGVCTHCSSTAPCAQGTVCSSTGVCVADICGGQCTNTQTCVVDSTGSLTGSCYDKCSATTACPTGHTCVEGMCVTDPCANVRCEVGSTCVAGQCSPSTCSLSLANCPSGTTCQTGVCVNLCASVDCPVGSTCDPTLGRCVQPICTADVKQCPSGEYLTRSASLNCEFPPCPTAVCSTTNCPAPGTCQNDHCVCGTVECSSGTVCTAHRSSTDNALTLSCDPIICAQTVITCPDGTVIRPDANCHFASCPTTCTVPCPVDTVCRSGTCVKTCGTTTCLATEECSNTGTCVPPSTCPAGCPIGTTCSEGRCLCGGVLCSDAQVCFPDLRSTDATYACRDPCAGNPCANNADGLTTCFPTTSSSTGYICSCTVATTFTAEGSLSGSTTVCTGCSGSTCPPPDPCSRCLTATGAPAECYVRDDVVHCNPCGTCPSGTKCEVSSTGEASCKATSPCDPNPCIRYASDDTGLFARQEGVCRVGSDGTAMCYWGTGCSSLNCHDGCVETVVAGSLLPVAQCVAPDVCHNVVCQRPGAMCVADATVSTGYSCVDPCDPNPCLGYPCTVVRDATGLVRPACSIPTTDDPCATAQCALGTVCKVDAAAPNRYSCVEPTDPCANEPCGTSSEVVCVSATAGTLSSIGGYACVRPCADTTCPTDQVCRVDATGHPTCVDSTVCPMADSDCLLYCGRDVSPILTDNCRCGCPTPTDPPASAVITTYTFTGLLDLSLLNRIGELLNSAVSGQIVVTVTSSNGSTTITVQHLSSDPNDPGVTPEQIAAAVESAEASSSSGVVGSASSGSLVSLF